MSSVELPAVHDRLIVGLTPCRWLCWFKSDRPLYALTESNTLFVTATRNMMRRPLALAIILSAVACAGGERIGTGDAGTGAPRLPAGDYEFDVEHDGRSRYYLVRIPTAASTGSPLPVLLAFHGGGGNPAQFKRSAGIDAVAEREGFIAVYPAGTGVGRMLLTWNAGTECCGRALALGVDDVGFTHAVINDLGGRVALDRTRVYATGHSNGAGMTYRLAVEAADLVAAIAPVAGASMGLSRATATPIPLMHIHSVDDPRALYDGGLGPEFPGTDHRVNHTPVVDELSAWKKLNGCAGEAVVREKRTGNADASAHVAEKLEWTCSAGSPVVHWRLHGVGHGWPGATEQGRERLVGPRTTVISAAEEAWTFVRGFSR
jgi:polyhydroxybutyrate depolymerase